MNLLRKSLDADPSTPMAAWGHLPFCLRGRAHKLPEDAENELYRVAQEALCNVRKHSRARSVSLLLRYRSGGVLLAIKDNGRGFSFKAPRSLAHGFGLPAMSARAVRLGGRVDRKQSFRRRHGTEDDRPAAWENFTRKE